MHRLWVSLAFGGLAASGLWPQAGEVRHLRIEPPSIVWMSAGSFVMGATDHDIHYAVELCQGERPLPLASFAPEMDGACSARRFVPEAPQRRVWTDAYGIDRTEVTHAAYRRCVTSGRCVPSRIADDDLRLAAPRMPVTGITWEEADAGGGQVEQQGAAQAAGADTEHAAALQAPLALDADVLQDEVPAVAGVVGVFQGRQLVEVAGPDRGAHARPPAMLGTMTRLSPALREAASPPATCRMSSSLR